MLFLHHNICGMTMSFALSQQNVNYYIVTRKNPNIYIKKVCIWNPYSRKTLCFSFRVRFVRACGFFSLETPRPWPSIFAIKYADYSASILYGKIPTSCKNFCLMQLHCVIIAVLTSQNTIRVCIYKHIRHATFVLTRNGTTCNLRANAISEKMAPPRSKQESALNR